MGDKQITGPEGISTRALLRNRPSSSRDAHGATLVEYLMLALLVLLAIVATAGYLGGEVNKTFDNPDLKTGMGGG